MDLPGLHLSMDTSDGQALLGTPNGNGVGWMIKEHQEYFGRKAFGSVVVWYKDNRFPYMLFVLKELPAEEPAKPPQPAPGKMARARL
jgi:hypothetical protein